jgi:predicted N-acetyltransferase YhbS
MSFRYREIELSDPDMAKAVLALAGRAFGHVGGLHDLKKLIHMPESGKEPLCLGAFWENTLVGFLACTPHRFLFERAPLLLYQPAWAVTDYEHRGKGIFRSLIQQAEEVLKGDGVGGMFASPNPLSGPVFTGPLGFSHLGPLMVGTSVGNNGIVKSELTDVSTHRFAPVVEDLLAWQRRRLGDETIFYQKDEEGNSIWARKRYMKKLGIQVPYWLVGGLEARHSEALGELLSTFPRPWLRLFFMTKNSRYLPFFKHVRPSTSQYLVWKSYDKNLPHHPSFDAMMGLFDHY